MQACRLVMTQIDFYHLTQSPLETALIMLLKKTLAAGKTGLILCPKPVASGLDDLLWSYEDDSWLPHGVDDGAGADRAKVWISTDPESNPINAPFLFLTHGVMPSKWDAVERAFILFDGGSEAQVDQARAQWKQISAMADVSASYFGQDDEGRWQKKA